MLKKSHIVGQTPTKQFMQFWKAVNVRVGVAVLLFAFSVFPSPTNAGFEEGRDAYSKGDYVIAAKEFRELVNPGIVEESDESKSIIEGIWDGFTWPFRWAWEEISGGAGSKKGYAPAQLYLGMMYALGQGVPQDYSEALKWFSLAAEQGDAQAQYVLGSMYFEGRGVPQVYSEAFKWFSLAAKQGDAAAQNSLANMYVDGKGVPKDYSKALKWVRMAAEQGDADAQNNLARMYALGRDVPQDYSKALKWVRMAAEQGNAVAQNGLGKLYSNGHGVAKNYVQAHMWYNLAAAQGHEAAKKSRSLAEKLMSRKQIAKAQRLAAEWTKKDSKKIFGER